MANLDFYAVDEDFVDLFNFIYYETDCRVFELSSDPGQNLQEFASVDELAPVLETASLKFRQGFLMLLQLWSPSVSANVRFRRQDLDPRKSGGHSFRYLIEGWGLIQIYLGAENNRVISHSHFGHNSLKRAQNWESIYLDDLGPVADWNWDRLMKISGRIQYHLRKRLAVSKIGARPVLPAAGRLLSKGYQTK